MTVTLTIPDAAYRSMKQRLGAASDKEFEAILSEAVTEVMKQRLELLNGYEKILPYPLCPRRQPPRLFYRVVAPQHIELLTKRLLKFLSCRSTDINAEKWMVQTDELPRIIKMGSKLKWLAEAQSPILVVELRQMQRRKIIQMFSVWQQHGSVIPRS